MSFNAIRENKILAKISEFTVLVTWQPETCKLQRQNLSICLPAYLYFKITWLNCQAMFPKCYNGGKRCEKLIELG